MSDVGRLSSPVLVGREDELARLESAWKAASQGQPSLVLIGGDAGVGKTRLTDALVEHVHGSSGRVLVGGCIDLGEGSLPFAPLVEALRSLARSEDAAALPELLGSARRDLARLAPALGGSSQGDERPSSTVVLQATVDALGRLGRATSVLFVVEDIHWADRSTLDLLGYLARTLHTEPVLVVATYRTDELHRRHQLRPFLAELSRSRSVERIDLVSFGRDQLAAQLTAIAGEAPPAHVIDEILRRSDGNPFIAEELLAARQEPTSGGLPASLRDILESRIAGLPPSARRILDVAATIGRTAHHSLLREVATQEDVSTALRKAVDHQVLVPGSGDHYRFRHALVQEAVYDRLLPGDRVDLHRAVAQVLEEEPDLASGGAEHVDAELAHHWEQAGDRERAFRSAVRAARYAESLPAFPEALTQYERALRLHDQLGSEALDEVTRYDLHRGAVRAAVGFGHFQRGLEHQRAATELTARSDSERRARSLRQLAHIHWLAGNGGEAATTIAEAVDLVEDAPSSATKAGVLAYSARLAALQGRFESGQEDAYEAVRIAEELGDDRERSRSLNSRGLIRFQLGERDEGVADLEAAIEAGRAASDVGLTATAYNNLLSVLAGLGPSERLWELRAEVEEWLADYHHAGTAFIMCNLAEIALRQGDVQGAAELLNQIVRHRLDGVYHMSYLSLASQVATLRGNYDLADRLTEELREVAAGTPDPQTWGPLLTASARRELLRGRPDRALEFLEELDERLGSLERPLEYVMVLAMRVWAYVEQALERGDAATEQHAREALRDLDDFDGGRSAGTSYTGVVALAHATATRLGEPDPAAWRRAVEASVHPFERAYATLNLAQTLIELEQREDASDALEKGIELADEQGFADLRERMQDLARRARLDLPGVELSAGELSLTPREREVLELVAEGRTNREIGEELFISQKTASVHVSNILSKLGVDNRVEAATAAHRLGLVGD
ncbi:MAG: AAA family ATPase [Nitriliruptorales bacterium]|nr:AAA family ATPase [Nitriliruptorales bacterium]